MTRKRKAPGRYQAHFQGLDLSPLQQEGLLSELRQLFRTQRHPFLTAKR